jgi:hypothetical protein
VSFYQLQFAAELNLLSQIYKLLGVIELSLRHVIPSTLSKIFIGNPSAHWFDPFEFDTVLNKEFRRALAQNLGSLQNIEESLTFRFWVAILSTEHYEKIWRKHLNLVFPNLPNPSSRGSYRSLRNRLTKAQNLRNTVAHYKISKLRDLPFQKENLEFIIFALGSEIN